MLKSLETALRLSEIREKLNDLNAVESPTEAQQTEERDLLGQLKTTEVEYREALTAEGDEHATVPVNGEDARVPSALWGAATSGASWRRLSSIAAPTGPNRSYSSIAGLAVESDPARFAPRCPSSIAPSRPAPTNVGTTEQPAILPVFADGRRGVSRGGSSDRRERDWSAYPVFDESAGRGRAAHRQRRAVDETTGAFSSSLLTPGRIQASVLLQARRRGAVPGNRPGAAGKR